MNPLLLSKLALIRNVSLERATSLRERASAKEQAEQQWMSLALQELDVAHEELRVVEEELHTQSEELSAVYGALDHERRRYRELFEDAPEPYIVTDSAGVMLQANRLACQLLNIDSHFVLGKPLSLYIWGEDRQVMRDVMDLLISSAEGSSFELQLRPRGAADPVRALASVRRASGERGMPAALRWILHERLVLRSSVQAKPEPPALPAQDQRQRLELEVVRERLKRADLERELNHRNQQLAFVAHELRNPLNTAAGWLAILNQEDTGPASRRHVVDVLTRNVKTLARMVEELVDQTRVVRDLVVLECEYADVRALLERVCDDARGLAHAKHLKFTCEIDDGIRVLRCDVYRLQQALSNVLGNAIKFVTSDGGAVQLTAALRDDTLECTIHDTGPGISRENLDTIFEPFIRVDAHGASTGLGLGLSIARKLIELHDGTITAESEGVGHGATFRVRLPLAGPRVQSAPPPPEQHDG